MYLFFGILRPLLRKLAGPSQEEIDAAIDAAAEEARALAEAEMAAAAEEEARLLAAEPDPMGPKPQGHESNLEAAKLLAREDPRMVANIIKAWVGGVNE
jgi:flagellar M-ring protein FliF